MRNRFCILAFAGIFTLGMAGSAALAQDNPAPPQNGNMHEHRGMDPDMQLKHMTKRLDLSADQQSQIKPILESRQQQMQQLWQDQSLSREDRHAKMQSIQADTSTKIEAVLNDTQKQKYEADQARMREHRMHNEGPSQDSAPPQPQQ
jgi:periplasmic protein CpxP/Spy